MKKQIKVKPIRTTEDHEEALKLLEELMDMNPASGSYERCKMVELADNIQKYELKKFPSFR